MKRAQGATPEAINAFFDRLRSILANFSIQSEDIWNMDESGLELGLNSNTTVLTESTKKRAFVSTPINREWVTIIETVSARGSTTKPVIIFKGKYVMESWLAQFRPDWHFRCSPRGWTDNEIGLDWLQHVFLPETTPKTGSHRLLVVDGHVSHTNPEFMQICHQNNIQLLLLPPHATHILQPLDIALFGPLKSKYKVELQRVLRRSKSKVVRKEHFIETYEVARRAAFCQTNCDSAWATSGMHPVDPSRPLQSTLIIKRPSTPPTTPAGHAGSSQALGQEDTLLSTPRRPQQVFAAITQLEQQESISKDVRRYLRRTAKAIGALTAQNAQLQTSLDGYIANEEEQNRSRKRKRVLPDPNTRFVSLALSTVDSEAATSSLEVLTEEADEEEDNHILQLTAVLNLCLIL